jgi:outer membrane lipoprotein LolB
MKYIAAGLCAALLAGCASAPIQAPQPHSLQLVQGYRSTFDTAGRLSVNYRKDGNPESLSGKFTWAQKPTIATISITPETATLVQADKAPRVARDIDSLTAETLGWSLPVAGLRDWLQGYATGADGKRFVASPANNTVTTADGWRLRFVSWQDERAAQPAPKRIDAERTAAAGVEEMAIRIVLDPQG